MKFTNEQAIQKAFEKHGLEKFSYPNINYQGMNRPINVICLVPGHGEFHPNAGNHLLLGSGCPLCAKNMKLTEAMFIEQSKAKYGSDTFDYSECGFTGRSKKVKLKCKADPTHDYFYPTVKDHLQKISGCPDCSGRRRVTTTSFVNRSEEKHNSKYTYKNVEIENNRSIVKPTCPHHGEFSQPAYRHLQGEGCPSCFNPIGSGEKELRQFIESLGVKTEYNVRMKNKKHIDILCVDEKIGFEFDGIWWHSEQNGKSTTYHLEKTLEAKKEDVRLIHIFEDEWQYKRDIVKSRIRTILGKASIKRFARKCNVVTISQGDAEKFLGETHIQGAGMPSAYNYGLVYEDNLVAVMTFNKLRYEETSSTSFELVRYSSKGSVIGGFSKLLKHFLKEIKVTEIISYSDRRWSEGNVYFKNGFEYVGSSKPGYAWYKGNTRYSRESMQKHKLEKKLKTFDPKLSEVENCIANGYFRVFDCGSDKWKFIVSQ